MNLAVIIDAEVLRCRYGGGFTRRKAVGQNGEMIFFNQTLAFVYID